LFSLFTFGRRHAGALARINRPPPGVRWRRARPKPSAAPVRAELVRSSGEIATPRGALRYEAGKHYLVQYGPGDYAPVRREIFEHTYRRRDDGCFEKKTDIVLRYFTLNHSVIIDTLEGSEIAQPGDWIIEGLAGELWPLAAREALERYERI
jgi:hypothetical protein